MKSWALPAATTAVVVVDMQNDNVHADGAFASSGAAEHAVAQNVIGNVRIVLDTARAIGVPVFHNRTVVYPQRPVGGGNAAIFRMLGPESLKVGTWGPRSSTGSTSVTTRLCSTACA